MLLTPSAQYFFSNTRKSLPQPAKNLAELNGQQSEHEEVVSAAFKQEMTVINNFTKQVVLSLSEDIGKFFKLGKIDEDESIGNRQIDDQKFDVKLQTSGPIVSSNTLVIKLHDVALNRNLKISILFDQGTNETYSLAGLSSRNAKTNELDFKYSSIDSPHLDSAIEDIARKTAAGDEDIRLDPGFDLVTETEANGKNRVKQSSVGKLEMALWDTEAAKAEIGDGGYIYAQQGKDEKGLLMARGYLAGYTSRILDYQ